MTRYIQYSYYAPRRIRGLILAPAHNTSGKHDATGAFHPGAVDFRSHYGLPDPVFIDNLRPHAERRRAALEAIRSASGPLDVVAYFGHGTPHGLPSLGFEARHIGDLAGALAGVLAASGKVVLYACSAGALGGFGAKLAEALGGSGSRQNTVYGHTCSGHSFYNPFVTGFPPGDFVVTPSSATFRAWRRRLRSTNLWLRFPLISAAQLAQDLSLG